MFVKIIESYRNVVAICDEDLIGKEFFEGKKMLHVKESFYKGDSQTTDEIRQIMRNWKAEDATFNIVGKESVKTAIEERIISKNCIGQVQGIPFALVLL